MASTPKQLRQAPTRTFENYVFTRVVGGSDAGLTPVSYAAFIPCSPGSSGNPGAGFDDDGISIALPIGFNFTFDTVTYKQFVVCSNGWMALVDPNSGSFSTNEVFTGGTQNGNIRTTFTSNAALLAPWFDNLRNVASDAQQLTGSLGSTKLSRITHGIEPPVAALNNTQFGVRYFADARSPKGRRLVVRWNSLSNNTTINTNLRYDAVLYENGNIEFRYASKASLTFVNNGTTESATIGIFMPNGTSRFRDMSTGLGYRDDVRIPYVYGGYTNSTAFTDVVKGNTVAYAGNLVPTTNWPAGVLGGATMHFQAPQNRRQVLPRLSQRVQDSRNTLPTVPRTGDSRVGQALGYFDDRTTVAFVSGVVNYPTTLPRLYGGTEPGIAGRQDLFAGDFLVTGSTVRSAIDAFVGARPSPPLAPFSENKQFEQTVSTSSFYATGSSLLQFSNTLTQDLKAKTLVRLTLPVEYNVAMPAVSSSVMFYRPKTRSWGYPSNSTYIISANGTGNDSGVSNGDIADPTSDAKNGRTLEDARGFGPIGNRVSSGSITRSGNFSQSDFFIGASWTRENYTNAIGKLYAKSIQNNQSYAATSDELFTLPIAQPFLIEKAVIEVPLAMGDGWFKNQTTCFAPLDNPTRAFDFAGPGLTFALYNQVTSETGTRLDLILTGTLTHKLDNFASLVISNFSSDDSTYQMRPVGFAAFGATPAGIVNPVSTSVGYVFTGSVPIQTIAGTSVGTVVKLMYDFTADGLTNVQTVRNLLAAPFVGLNNVRDNSLVNGTPEGFNQTSSIAFISPIGRGATGFDASIRSVYGKEFTGLSAVGHNNLIVNPFYVTGSNPNVSGTLSGLPAQIDATITSLTSSGLLRMHAAVPLLQHQPNPYLVYPGDKLVLAVSKMRPFYYNSPRTTFSSGSIQDDVQLITGSINITLYGSQLSQGEEYHNTLNQQLSSNAVSELFVGSAPNVADRFEGDYRDVYSGSYTDVVCGGALVTPVINSSNTLTLLQGNRGQVFSKNTPLSSPPPGTGPYDTSDSLSYQIQPFNELAGTVRVNSSVSSTERYWDSMMPAIDACFAVNGAGIFLRDPGISPINNSDRNNVDPTSVDITKGFIWFDFRMSSVYPSTAPLVDDTWTWSYPFEPRYSSVARQLAPQKAFNATYVNNGGSPLVPNPTVTSIPPTLIPSFIFGSVGTLYMNVPRTDPVTTVPTTFYQHWLVDVITDQLNPISVLIGSSPHQMTASAGVNDVLRSLYGFGDVNNIMFPGTSIQIPGFAGLRFGTNHAPDSRRKMTNTYGVYGWGSVYNVGPIIRGWKYGAISALPTFTKAYFRRSRFGQFRDMLEQRPYTKFYNVNDVDLPHDGFFQEGVTQAPVTVKFVDAFGNLTRPENTWSFNLSTECTSSVPYLDGQSRNRSPINTNTLNTNLVTIRQDSMHNITI